MAFRVTPKCWFFTVALIFFPLICCKSGYAEDSPAENVAKALLCFNNKIIYSSCDESYRLSVNGNINVPSEATDQYCNGPCLAVTRLMLNCIDNILSKFLFYNKATIQDIRETLHAGCGYTSQRGNFNVAEHIQGESRKACRVSILTYLYVYVLIVAVGCSLLLSYWH